MLGAVAAIAIGFLFAAPPAHALTTYNSCSSIAGSHADNVEINVTGSCNITNNISADGYIKITATGSISTQRIRAGYSVQVSTSGGSIDIQDTITSNTEGNGGNVYITATGNVKTKSITAQGDADSHGAVEIRANTNNATSTVFTLGASTSNGVDGSIVTSTPGGATGPYGVEGGVNITNGNSSATGGITLTSMNNIQVVNSGSRSGIIALNAQNGTLTLPSGTLSADGPSGYGAGYIFLKGNTISTASGTVISASQTSGASGSHHYVMLAANTLSLTGDGLEIRANGNGVTTGSALVALLPKDGFSVSSSNDFETMYWSVQWDNFMMTSAEMKVTGSGPLKVTANGDYSRVAVSGDPIVFENSGNVTIEAKGAIDHQILFANYALPNGPDVNFENTGDITLDASANTTGDGGLVQLGTLHDVTFGDTSGTVTLKASGVSDGNGGEINVWAHTIEMLKSSFVVEANGSTSGNGDGGKIYIGTSWDSGSGFILDADATATLSANASTNGTGNAVYNELTGGDPKAIQFYIGDNILKLGTDPGQISLYAQGGNAGGNGGAVVVAASQLHLMTADAVLVNAIDGDSNGGGFLSWAYLNYIAPGLDVTTIDASGRGSGEGGWIQTYHGISNLEVNKLFKVTDDGILAARAQFVVDAESNQGRLVLNNITCQRRGTGLSWPETYWNCIHPDASTAADQMMPPAAAKLHTTMKNALSARNTQVYLFEDITKFMAFHGTSAPVNGTDGISGYTELDLRISAAFLWEIYPDGNANNSGYYSGTIIHELGHQLDERVWNTASANNATWLAARNADTTAFDVGYPGTCAAKVDADRTDPAVGLGAICGLFDGSPGNPLKSNSVGFDEFGGESFLNPQERFTRAFAEAYRRAYPAAVITKVYGRLIDARLPLQQGYMDTMIGNGAP